MSPLDAPSTTSMNPTPRLHMRPPRCIADNTGKLMSKRIKAYDRSTVVLSYRPHEANALRLLAQTIKLKGDDKPSLSLLSRRALVLYVAHIERLRASGLEGFAAEVAALENLTVPKARPKTKRAAR